MFYQLCRNKKEIGMTTLIHPRIVLAKNSANRVCLQLDVHKTQP